MEKLAIIILIIIVILVCLSVLLSKKQKEIEILKQDIKDHKLLLGIDIEDQSFYRLLCDNQRELKKKYLEVDAILREIDRELRSTKGGNYTQKKIKMRKFIVLVPIYLGWNINPKINDEIQLIEVRLTHEVVIHMEWNCGKFEMSKYDFEFMLRNQFIKEVFETNDVERPKSEIVS